MFAIDTIVWAPCAVGGGDRFPVPLHTEPAATVGDASATDASAAEFAAGSCHRSRSDLIRLMREAGIVSGGESGSNWMCACQGTKLSLYTIS